MSRLEMAQPADKMGVREGDRLFLVNAPTPSLEAIDLPPVTVPVRLTGCFDHIIVFVRREADLVRQCSRLRGHLEPTGRLWIAWPKKGRLPTNLDIKSVIRIGYNCGLVESTTLRIDDTWTALKFTWPKPGKRYNNKYGTLPETPHPRAPRSG